MFKRAILLTGALTILATAAAAQTDEPAVPSQRDYETMGMCEGLYEGLAFIDSRPEFKERFTKRAEAFAALHAAYPMPDMDAAHKAKKLSTRGQVMFMAQRGSATLSGFVSRHTGDCDELTARIRLPAAAPGAAPSP